jgi:hypothetical protein
LQSLSRVSILPFRPLHFIKPTEIISTGPPL